MYALAATLAPTNTPAWSFWNRQHRGLPFNATEPGHRHLADSALTPLVQ
jgi:hypothetical protein